MQGIIIINKPQGFTSQDVVSKVKKILNVKNQGLINPWFFKFISFLTP